MIQKFLDVKKCFQKLIQELKLKNICLNYQAEDILFTEELQLYLQKGLFQKKLVKTEVFFNNIPDNEINNKDF